MYQDSITGNFHFDGNEEDVAMKWMWTLLTNLSWWAKLQVIYCVLFVKIPACHHHLWEDK